MNDQTSQENAEEAKKQSPHYEVPYYVMQDLEIIGKRCADSGVCKHSCEKSCFRKDGCVPLSCASSFLNDDWTFKDPIQK